MGARHQIRTDIIREAGFVELQVLGEAGVLLESVLVPAKPVRHATEQLTVVFEVLPKHVKETIPPAVPQRRRKDVPLAVLAKIDSCVIVYSILLFAYNRSIFK